MITIDIKGLTELQARLKTMPKEVKVIVSAVVERGAQTFVRNAQREAPVRKTIVRGTKGTFGSNLKQEITYYPRGGVELSRTVVSANKASPYMEWGTITFVSVPPELKAYAIQFKGRGIRKTGGIFPVPYFFKQQIPVKQQIEKELQANINDLKL